jgi:hypothetical protein
MKKDTFDIIVLNGRPAAGKSEVIDYLKKIPLCERIKRFHIGEFEENDDFPILWERFEDDDIYTKHGKERLISDTHFIYNNEQLNGYVFKDKFFWNFLIERLNLNYNKKLRNNPSYHDKYTILFEFARGSEHGGFREAYQYLSDDVISKAATLYIKCSFEESLRKNRRRYDPNKPDSILQHALEDKKLELLYKASDWEEFSASDANFLHVKNHKIPYAIFNNEPEITDKPDLLGKHLEEVLNNLWKINNNKKGKFYGKFNNACITSYSNLNLCDQQSNKSQYEIQD